MYGLACNPGSRAGCLYRFHGESVAESKILANY